VDARDAVRTEAAYDALLAEVGNALPGRLRGVLVDVLRALEGWREADRALSGRAEMTLLPALSDMKAQLARLVHPGFVGEAGTARLRRYPAYLAALRHRRDRLDDGIAAVNRDRQLMAQVTDLENAYLHAVAALPEGRPPGDSLRSVRWMLEEYRISLFAQQVGTAGPVSDQRIRKALAAV
jgi:ATP-dependent helicase HrpA